MQFPGFYGNEGLKRRLSSAQRRLSHFYILDGPAGSGKKTLAQILAAAMECEAAGEIPCGVCPACRKALKHEHPDIITVDSDTATVPIRLIRQMQADAYVRPNEGRKKIYLLPRAQDMQVPAQNALLKLLEDPPEYCAFLLMTDSAEKLLETIRSRAVVLTLSPLSRNTLAETLRRLEPNAAQEELARAMDRSEGYLGAALKVLHAPETALDQQEAALTSALASRDELKLLEALLPLEKLKRQDLITLLTGFQRTLVRAMDPGAISTEQSRLLSSACTGQQLYTAAQAVCHAISMLQANGSAGHAVGSMMAQMS